MAARTAVLLGAASVAIILAAAVVGLSYLCLQALFVVYCDTLAQLECDCLLDFGESE